MIDIGQIWDFWSRIGEGFVKGRWKNLGPSNASSKLGPGIIELLSGDAPNFDHLADYPAVSPPNPISGLIEIPVVRSPSATPKKRKPRRAGALVRLWRRQRAGKPWLAPDFANGVSPTSLEEKNRKFKSKKIKDLWAVFYQFRAEFPRPNQTDIELKRLCLSWKKKHDGNSPRALPRFFVKYPEIAVWAIWVERAIHETRRRSGENQSPQVDLLRECLRILADVQMQRLGKSRA